jgi:cytoskeletal protein CcmA (bactofilin family)
MSVFSVNRADREPSDGAAAVLSVLARGFRVIGTIESEGTVKIEGHVDGDVHVGCQLLVAAGGVVLGTIHADEVVVAGRVEGDIVATARIVLQPGCDVRGDLTAPVVAVQEGGIVNGRLRATRVEMELPAGEQLRKSA